MTKDVRLHRGTSDPRKRRLPSGRRAREPHPAEGRTAPEQRPCLCHRGPSEPVTWERARFTCFCCSILQSSISVSHQIKELVTWWSWPNACRTKHLGRSKTGWPRCRVHLIESLPSISDEAVPITLPLPSPRCRASTSYILPRRGRWCKLFLLTGNFVPCFFEPELDIIRNRSKQALHLYGQRWRSPSQWITASHRHPAKSTHSSSCASFGRRAALVGGAFIRGSA